jgi:hypothetical protein
MRSIEAFLYFASAFCLAYLLVLFLNNMPEKETLDTKPDMTFRCGHVENGIAIISQCDGYVDADRVFFICEDGYENNFSRFRHVCEARRLSRLESENSSQQEQQLSQP